MVEKEKILTLPFYSYKGIFTGSDEGIRYRIAKISEEDVDMFEVYVWREPYGFEATPKEEMEKQTFAFTEEGKEELVAWLNQKHEEWF